VLRQKANHLVKLAGESCRRRFGDLIAGPGQSIWLGYGLLTAQHAYPVNLLAYWEVVSPNRVGV